MMIAIPDVLDAATLAHVRGIIDPAPWIDGNATSGHQSALAKRNLQLAEGSDAARAAGNIILDALGRNPLFIAAALPLKVYPPLFNSYGDGQGFDTHVDSAVRILSGSDFRIRSDLSATLFLEEPDAYDGGELTIEGAFGTQQVKLLAGHMIVYPASSLHHVTPVTRGRRIASFFWIQSMVRSEADRSALFALDSSVQALGATLGQDNADVIRLTGVYHNLLRRWVEM